MAGKSLGSREDIQKAKDSTAGQQSRPFLKIPDSKTPWYILSMEFHDGFSHWVTLPGNRRTKVVCNADPDKNGFDPDNCVICAHVLEEYNRAKDVGGKAGDKRVVFQ